MRNLFFIAAMAATPALADLDVSFRDGAPKDQFVIKNVGPCPISDIVVSLDLTPSQGRVIFDITAAGAGVEVFQPLEIVQGRSSLGSLPQVRDGDTGLQLPITELMPTEQIVFTIDVDDTIGERGITVSGSEMAGAEVTVTGAYAPTQNVAAFDAQGRARILMRSCT